MSFEPISPSSAGRAGKIALLVLPFLAGFLCMLLSFVPFSRIFGVEVAPAFGLIACLLYTSPSPRDLSTSRMPSSA